MGKLFLLFLILGNSLFSQNYPLFGPEKKVHIVGLTFDAMEPFISRDGQLLFFNSLNSGGNTNLYYATRVSDTVFNYIGLVNGCYDPSLNHLDGVPSLDSLNNFYWVSLRNYPIQIENLHKGLYSGGNVSTIKRVYGDFNIASPGWLIMDAAVSHEGDKLYYCNAFFNACPFGMPCKARIGVAEQVNDTTFNKLNLTDTIFSNVNDTNYTVYAPQVTEDGLELYYTRILKSTINSEICVSVRNNSSAKFSLPNVIHSNLGFVPEAASPTRDKQILYYHQKVGSGLFQLFLRYKILGTSLPDYTSSRLCSVYPNPAKSIVNVNLSNPADQFMISVVTVEGKCIFESREKTSIPVTEWQNGLYFVRIQQKNYERVIKFIKE